MLFKNHPFEGILLVFLATALKYSNRSILTEAKDVGHNVFTFPWISGKLPIVITLIEVEGGLIISIVLLSLGLNAESARMGVMRRAASCIKEQQGQRLASTDELMSCWHLYQ